MSKTRFFPFGLDQAGAFEAAEQRINGALSHDQPGAVFQPPQHFEAIEAAGPQGRQGCQFDAAFSQLYFPFIR